MKTVEEYLRHAAECERIAQQAISEERRDMILHMAATWRSLAETRRNVILKQAASPAEAS